MSTIDSLVSEFERETETTRKHLERLPATKLDWRPHAKSFTAGGLASHIVECVGWSESIFTGDEFNFDPAVYKPYAAASVTDLLKAFDGRVEVGKQALTRTADAALMELWRLKDHGRCAVRKVQGRRVS